MTDAYSTDAAQSTESTKSFSPCITIPISWPNSVSSSEEVHEINNEFENHRRFGVTENRKNVNENFSLLVDHEFHILNHVSDHISRSSSFLENEGTIHFPDINFNENNINESCEDFGCDNKAFSKEVKDESSTEIEEAELQEPLEDLSPVYEELATKVVSLKPTESVLRKQLPTYLSLSNEFLSDEPPRYELVTGKKLKSELVSSSFAIKLSDYLRHKLTVSFFPSLFLEIIL